MKVLKFISINLVVLIALLALIDPWLKSAHYPTGRSVRLREPAPNMDFIEELSQHKIKRSQGLGTKTKYRLRTNNQGFFIGENNSVVADSVDIIFWGGSTTECIYVDEGKRFPYLVGEKLMNTATNQNITTLNGGLRGNHSLHSLISFIAKGIPLKPKTVVLMHNVNDLYQLEFAGSYWDSPKDRSILLIKENQHSFKNRLYQLGKSVKELLIPNLYKKIHNTSVTNRRKDPDYKFEWQTLKRNKDAAIDKLLIDYEKTIRSFVHVAKVHGINVILMTQFNRLNPEDDFSRSLYASDFDQLCRNYKRFNQKIRDISVSENVHLIDLARKIPSDSTTIYDFLHLNTYGSELATDIITKELIKINPEYSLIRGVKDD